jgi:hypothetical protein
MNNEKAADDLFAQYGSEHQSIQDAIEALALAFLYAGKLGPVAIVLPKESLDYYTSTLKLKTDDPAAQVGVNVIDTNTANGKIDIIDEAEFITRGKVEALDLREKVLFITSDDDWHNKLRDLGETVQEAGGVCIVGLPTGDTVSGLGIEEAILALQNQKTTIDRAIQMLEMKKTPCGAV